MIELLLLIKLVLPLVRVEAQSDTVGNKLGK